MSDGLLPNSFTLPFQEFLLEKFVEILAKLEWHDDFKSLFACMKDCLEDKFRHDSSKDRIYEVTPAPKPDRAPVQSKAGEKCTRILGSNSLKECIAHPVAANLVQDTFLP